MDDAGAQHNGGKCTLWMGLLGHPPFVGCLFLTQTCGGRNHIPLKSAVSTVPSLFSAPGSFFILRLSGFIAVLRYQRSTSPDRSIRSFPVISISPQSRRQDRNRARQRVYGQLAGEGTVIDIASA